MSRIIEKPIDRVELTVKLTEEERMDRAARCATQMSCLDKVRDEAKESSDKFKAKIKPLTSEVRALSVAYTTGMEVRSVTDAVRVFNIESNKTWISHRGVQYDERDISTYELAQVTMKPLFKGGDKAAVKEPFDDSEFPGDDIRGVIHEETCVKTKKDHTVTKEGKNDDGFDDVEAL